MIPITDSVIIHGTASRVTSGKSGREKRRKP
jgi:hypothetical protein